MHETHANHVESISSEILSLDDEKQAKTLINLFNDFLFIIHRFIYLFIIFEWMELLKPGHFNINFGYITAPFGNVTRYTCNLPKSGHFG